MTRSRCAVLLGCAALACGFDAGGTPPTNDGLGGGSSTSGALSSGPPVDPTRGSTTSGMTGTTNAATLTAADTTTDSAGPSTGPGPVDPDTTSTDTTETTGGDDETTQGPPEPAWAFARRVTIAGSDSGLTGPVLDIPLPIELDDTRISYENAAADGTDLRFVDELSGASLPYEIEVWDPNGVSVVWVEVPVVSDEAPTQLEMRYGNPEASDVQDAAAVWSNDYVLVHHLANGCAGFTDSTGAGHNAGCIDITDAAHGPARFGSGMDFTGDGHLAVPDHPDFDLGTALSFEAMVFITAEALEGSAQRIAVGKGEQFRLLPERGGGGGGIRATVWSNGGSGRNASAGTIPLGWHHLVGVGIGDDEVRVYLDGVLEDESMAGGALDLVDNEIRIGDTMLGGVDEVRLSAVARSGDWILLQAEAASDLLMSYGPEVAL